MLLFVVSLLLFLGFHLVPSLTGVRAGLVARLGEQGYRGAFSLLSLVTLALLIWGYAQSPFVEVWWPPVWTRHLALLLMLFAFIAVMAAFFPGRIKAALKHPMLVSVKIWALAHLLANGDLASMLLFGGFLAYAVIDRILVKRREERIPGQAPSGPRNDLMAVGIGLALYLAFAFGLHEWLIGVPVIG